MDYVDLVGFVAASLVLTTFCMNSMRVLRCVAMLSNLAFIGYGLAEDLVPVIALHILLLPVNGFHLLRDIRLKERRFVK